MLRGNKKFTDMARFSVGGEADEGPSSPRRKRQKNRDSSEQPSWHDTEDENVEIVEEDDELLEEENDQSEEQQQERVEEHDLDEEEEGEDDDILLTPIVLPRSSNRPSPVRSRNGAICVTLTDTEVLDCPICYDSLTIPVFQVFLYLHAMDYCSLLSLLHFSAVMLSCRN